MIENLVDAVTELEARWAAAEVAGDTATLEMLTAPEFRLVGPLGFVLSRDQWLQRYEGGGLTTIALDWRDLDTTILGSTAITIGIHDQRASYRGRPADGTFRSTHVWVRREDDWRLAAIQLSAIAAPPPG